MSKADENDLPDTTPWDIRVDQLMREYNATQQIARDLVILDWLLKGDTRPFTAFVIKGHHIPGIEVIRYVALMMNPAKGTDENVPFALVISSRGRKGRRRNPAIEIRDKLLAQKVELLMETKSYNEALNEVADLLGEGLDSDSRDTVEKAYKRYKSKPQR